MPRKKDGDQPDDFQKHYDKTSRRIEKTVGHNRDDAYCPRCQEWYSIAKNGDQHAGH